MSSLNRGCYGENSKFIDKVLLDKFRSDGVIIVERVLTAPHVFELKSELCSALSEDDAQDKKVFDENMIHNCMMRGKSMLSLLDNPILNRYLKALFAPTCILYAYQSSSLLPRRGNYGSRVHVDSPRFIPNYMTNIGVIFPLDPFTEENGATYYLEGSHLTQEIPSDSLFYTKAKRIICEPGSMIVFNARLVHAAGINRTEKARHALTMNFCRSYMRQRFDFARMVPKELIHSLGEDGQRLLGMNVRVPTSLEEFYLPEDRRLYKSNQG